MNALRLLLRRIAWWILSNIRPSETELDAALRQAYVDAGISLEHFYPEYVLGKKLHEVLLHAAKHRGNPLQTLADVRALLR